MLDAKIICSLKNQLQSYNNNNNDCGKVVQFFLFTLMNQIQVLNQKVGLYGRQGCGQLTFSEYSNLQVFLQKSQEEVRQHIRVSQQLKIYLNLLQEKNEGLQSELQLSQIKYEKLFENLRQIDNEKKQLIKKLNILQRGLMESRKLTSHKNSKVMSEASIQYSQSQHGSHYKNERNKIRIFSKITNQKRQNPRHLKSLNQEIIINIEQKKPDIGSVEEHKTIEINGLKHHQMRTMKKAQQEKVLVGKRNMRSISNAK